MNGIKIRSYLEDSMSAAPDMGGSQPDSAIRGNPKPGGLTEFSGSYAPDECQLGMLGGSEYYRAYRESELARMAPDVLSRSVRSTWDDGFISMISPDKPAPVSLAGYDVFGPQSFTTTTRNMILDLRGEAAYAPNLSGEIPVGASVSSLAMGAAVNYADCDQGCGCGSNPTGIQLPSRMDSRPSVSHDNVGSMFGKCENNCRTSTVGGSERTNCLRGCAQDVPVGNRLAMAGSNEDLEQDCVVSCVSAGGSSERDCITTCRSMFCGASAVGANRGGMVSAVHPAEFFTPKQVKPATVLRPYQS
jgi:hypothetical protein